MGGFTTETQRARSFEAEGQGRSVSCHHVTDAQRIARAAATAAPGAFALDRPARELVTHYEALCKNVTWDFYRAQLGSQLSPNQLEPTANLLAARAS